MTKIGLVGGYGSSLDTSILSDVVELIPEVAKLELDFIDLRLNRDFLTETHDYDIVVLCYIFILSQAEQKEDPLYEKILKHTLDTRVSPLHTPENWRKRLLETGAENILVFGFSPISEITGQFLGGLPNYKLVIKKGPTGDIWWYQRG